MFKADTMLDEEFLIERIREGSRDAFSLIFRYYYKDLVLFGGTFLPDRAICEDIVQNTFLKLWEGHKSFVINSSLKSFLLKIVQNACLDEIRHRAVKLEHEDYVLSFNILADEDAENYILYSDLLEHYQKAMSQIPEQYRVAFEMSRMEGLKYREIADRLSVSERTVEVRIGKALELLRKYLKFFLSIFI